MSAPKPTADLSLNEDSPFLFTTEDGHSTGNATGHQQDALGHSLRTTNVKRLLYTSHFLSAWNCRLFEFGAVLFLAEAFPGTLLPSSVYALVRAAAAITLSPRIGDHIDRNDRLSVVRLSIIGQRVAVISSSLIFTLFFLSKDSSPGYVQICLLVILCLLAPVEKCASIMNFISIEKDWAVVVAEHEDELLETVNSQMRRIDLFCKLVGPLAIALIDGFSTQIAVATVGGLSAISVFIEDYTIAKVYNTIPALQVSHNPIKRPAVDVPSGSPDPPNSWKKILIPIREYMTHQAFLPSFALSLLFFTVLSFSGQMITFLVATGFTPTQIGLLRTAAAILELSATWLAPCAMKRVGPIRAGLWAINWQLLCLTPAVLLFSFLHAPVNAAWALIAGVIFSRLGLWGFDLSVQILVQEAVEADTRGTFSSLEASAQNTFELCAYLSTVVFSRPNQFHYPIALSILAVIAADGLYARFVRETRGHLIHLSSRCAGGKWVAGTGYRRVERGDDISMRDLDMERPV